MLYENALYAMYTFEEPMENRGSQLFLGKGVSANVERALERFEVGLEMC